MNRKVSHKQKPEAEALDPQARTQLPKCLAGQVTRTKIIIIMIIIIVVIRLIIVAILIVTITLVIMIISKK